MFFSYHLGKIEDTKYHSLAQINANDAQKKIQTTVFPSAAAPTRQMGLWRRGGDGLGARADDAAATGAALEQARDHGGEWPDGVPSSGACDCLLLLLF